MFSLIISSFNEVENTKKLIQTIKNAFSKNDQLIVVSPNKILEKYLFLIKKDFQKTFIKDSKKGKPAALNLALKEAKGKFVICTDGDVLLRENSISEILKSFTNKEVGLVSGHPVSLDDKQTLFGYWSHFLTHAAHITRQNRENEKKFLIASGYLLAFRNSLIESVPINTLVDDAWISHFIYKNGHQIAYAPLAKVDVFFPKNFKDWINQKVRSVGGYQEKFIQESKANMRSIKNESLLGIKLIFTYPKSFKEYFFTFLLICTRIYLWFLIFCKFKITKQKAKWVRIESSKF